MKEVTVTYKGRLAVINGELWPGGRGYKDISNSGDYTSPEQVRDHFIRELKDGDFVSGTTSIEYHLELREHIRHNGKKFSTNPYFVALDSVGNINEE